MHFSLNMSNLGMCIKLSWVWIRIRQLVVLFLPMYVLQSVARIICSPLSCCINHIIDTSTFPNELKLSDILPIHKGKNAFLSENYRPISILPTMSKVLETIVADQISDFMESKLSKLPWCFRSKHGTQHALFKLVQKWQKTLDQTGKVGTVLMDLKLLTPYHTIFSLQRWLPMVLVLVH